MRGNKKVCVLVACNRASLPIGDEFLAERTLTDPTFDEVVTFGLADGRVVKDGIDICLDVTRITVSKVLGELDECAAVHVVAAFIAFLKNRGSRIFDETSLNAVRLVREVSGPAMMPLSMAHCESGP